MSKQTSKKKKDKPKLWAGRFSEATDPLVDVFTNSIPFDYRLLPYDLAGSLAHLKMLARQGIIPVKEAKKIRTGLLEIQKEWELGKLSFPLEDEDVHMFVEKRLTKKIGAVAGKIHTARSRNDQVALDLRLYLRDQIQDLKRELQGLQKTLLERAKNQGHLILPGYTHLQRAQPVILGHHLLAYLEMFYRDQQRLSEVLRRVNILPLGSAALAGTSFPIDRTLVAKELGFEQISPNSMDAVSDRDFVIEFLSAGATLMMHYSRMSEELILWSSSEFDFVEISDAFCTGSSIMPQKKNPDVPELIRGKTGRVYGHLMGMLTTMKALPLTYNKDLQEDKEPVFDSVETLLNCTRLLCGLWSNIRFRTDSMEKAAETGYLLATDLADYLVKKGLDFRRAHQVVGTLVAYALKRGWELKDIPLSELKTFHPIFEEDVHTALDLRSAMAERNSQGGTAPQQVKKALKEMEKKI
ncbi:MAG: argininosuccinate lyase [Deltaproteobacteria bacterium RBG_13_43_22]|nr:MAG: argininosuccinate lyase [Deltaproteobacteria bacterium RBG_13_43_22]